MSRTVSDAKLESRSARAALKVRKKPYYRAIEPGLHLGYRKAKHSTSWLVRVHLDGKGYQLRNLDGIPDDKVEADGQGVLSYAQALEKGRAFFKAANAPATAKHSVITVEDACEDYIEYLRAERKTGDESAGRLKKHIYPKIGKTLIVKLTTSELEKCKRGMVRKDKDDPDVERASKDSANRVMSMLRAALNRAFADETNNIPSDAAWRRVKQFRGVGRARQIHLDVAQSNKLIGACSGAFQRLVTAALLTGARAPHELAERKVCDFQRTAGTLTVTDGKTGSRDIVLTQEAITYFTEITKDRDPSEFLLPRDDGTPWLKNRHQKPMQRAVKDAELDPKCTIYACRHTYASQSILSGMNLKLLAENMGTSIRMLEKHYGKFIAASRRSLVEKSAFKLGLAVTPSMPRAANDNPSQAA